MKQTRLLHSAWIRAISLLVTEVFLYSSILPAWALPSDFLRPRPAISTREIIGAMKQDTARDGGGEDAKIQGTLSQWTEERLGAEATEMESMQRLYQLARQFELLAPVNEPYFELYLDPFLQHHAKRLSIETAYIAVRWNAFIQTLMGKLERGEPLTTADRGILEIERDLLERIMLPRLQNLGEIEEMEAEIKAFNQAIQLEAGERLGGKERDILRKITLEAQTLSSVEQGILRLSAILHDVGKGSPNHYRLKDRRGERNVTIAELIELPRVLTAAERKIVAYHAAESWRSIKGSPERLLGILQETFGTRFNDPIAHQALAIFLEDEKEEGVRDLEAVLEKSGYNRMEADTQQEMLEYLEMLRAFKLLVVYHHDPNRMERDPEYLILRRSTRRSIYLALNLLHLLDWMDAMFDRSRSYRLKDRKAWTHEEIVNLVLETKKRQRDLSARQALIFKIFKEFLIDEQFKNFFEETKVFGRLYAAGQVVLDRLKGKERPSPEEVRELVTEAVWKITRDNERARDGGKRLKRVARPSSGKISELLEFVRTEENVKPVDVASERNLKQGTWKNRGGTVLLDGRRWTDTGEYWGFAEQFQEFLERKFGWVNPWVNPRGDVAESLVEALLNAVIYGNGYLPKLPVVVTWKIERGKRLTLRVYDFRLRGFPDDFRQFPSEQLPKKLRRYVGTGRGIKGIRSKGFTVTSLPVLGKETKQPIGTVTSLQKRWPKTKPPRLARDGGEEKYGISRRSALVLLGGVAAGVAVGGWALQKWWNPSLEKLGLVFETVETLPSVQLIGYRHLRPDEQEEVNRAIYNTLRLTGPSKDVFNRVFQNRVEDLLAQYKQNLQSYEEIVSAVTTSIGKGRKVAVAVELDQGEVELFRETSGGRFLELSEFLRQRGMTSQKKAKKLYLLKEGPDGYLFANEEGIDFFPLEGRELRRKAFSIFEKYQDVFDELVALHKAGEMPLPVLEKLAERAGQWMGQTEIPSDVAIADALRPFVNTQAEEKVRQLISFLIEYIRTTGERDKAMAGSLQAYASAHPDVDIFVIVGSTHVPGLKRLLEGNVAPPSQARDGGEEKIVPAAHRQTEIRSPLAPFTNP